MPDTGSQEKRSVDVDFHGTHLIALIHGQYLRNDHICKGNIGRPAQATN